MAEDKAQAFRNENFQWRETYIIMFDRERRPSLKEVEKRLLRLNPSFCFSDQAADPKGRFDTLTLLAPNDCAAVDISYADGDDVLQHAAEMALELESASPEDVDQHKLMRLPQCDARFEVMHFQQVLEDEDPEEEPDDGFDPSSLLLVLDALVEMTDGICVDPQSGSLL